MSICTDCGQDADLNEADMCDECHDAWIAKETASLKPLYDAEKRAGLLRPQSEINQQLRDAGRGHLVKS